MDENDNFVGIFEDRVNANLTKRLRFTLTESIVEYKLLNPDDVSDFNEEEEQSVDFAAKNCVKGISCKNTCIDPNKVCRHNPPQPHSTKVAKAKTRAKSSTSAPAPSSSAKTKAKSPTSAPVSSSSAKSQSVKASKSKTNNSQQQNTNSPSKVVSTNDAELNTKRQDLVNRFGQKAVEDAENNVKSILDNPDTDVFIRVGQSSTLELILGDRFKTSAELGTQTHNIPFLNDQYQTARNRVESKVLGYDENKTKPEDRPIYGYLGGKDMKGASHADVAESYGSISVKLKKDVKDRATFTGSDSFKSGIASEVKNDGSPPPPNAASLVSSTRHGYDKDKLPSGYPSYYASKSGDKDQLTAAAKAKTIDDLADGLAPTGNKYVEAQIHGKVTPNDIAEIHFEPRGTGDRPTPAVAKFAQDNGVDLYVNGKKLSATELDNIINPPKDKRSQKLKDLDDALGKGDFDKVAEITDDIYNQAKKQKLAPGEKDAILKQLYAESGFDGKPEIKTKQEMDVLAQSSKVMLTRGVSGSTPSEAAKLTEQFRTGDYFVGNGIYGNGTYVGHSGKFSTDGLSFIPQSDAKSQKSAWKNVEKYGYIDPNGATLRMALKDDAVVVTAKAMEKEIKTLQAKVDTWEQTAKQKILSQTNPRAKKDIAAYKKSLDVDNAILESTYPLSPVYTAEIYTIPHKQKSKYGDTRQVVLRKDPFGDYSFFAPDGTKIKTGNSLTKTLKKVREAYAKDYVVGQVTQDIEKKATRMRDILGISPNEDGISGVNDLGEGTSGRFAVIRGIDAVALNNSYEKDTFMNLLNRTKVFVQDTDLDYKTGQKVGAGV